jgi:hypothetical protein
MSGMVAHPKLLPDRLCFPHCTPHLILEAMSLSSFVQQCRKLGDLLLGEAWFRPA